MKNIFQITTFILSFSLFLHSCTSDDDIPMLINEEEVITTVIVTFTNLNQPITLTSFDEDGDGPLQPEITVSGNFSAGETYSGMIRFINQSVIPNEEITDEILEEGDEHQIFYQQNGLGAFSYSDQDTNGNPIGLSFSFTANSTPVSGNLTITLVHEPDKFAEGVAEGNPQNAGGSTDAHVVFPIIIE